MLWREGEFEATRRLLREPRFGFFGDVRGVVVEDHFDRRVRRVSLVEQLKEFDELATAMAMFQRIRESEPRNPLRSTTGSRNREPFYHRQQHKLFGCKTLVNPSPFWPKQDRRCVFPNRSYISHEEPPQAAPK